MPTRDDLKIYQAQPLYLKVMMTKQRIREWVDTFGVGGVYVSFSGGKDSTVLLHIVREMYGNDIPAVFVNTGLEYPEIQKFVKTFENVEILHPKMRFDEVIKKYGYPIISKEVCNTVRLARKNIKEENFTSLRVKKLHGDVPPTSSGESRYNCPQYLPLTETDFNISDQCCDVMKKAPAHIYSNKTGRAPILAQMAEESRKRETAWYKSGCNGFDMKKPQSNPMAFWTEQDVLQYVKENDLPIASVYGDVVVVDKNKNQYSSTLIDGLKLKTTGCHRTGCIFCAFGAHCRDDKRFLDLKQTHPVQYAYCIGGGEFVNGLWQPNKEGLGMGYVFDRVNEIYGSDFIRYK